MLKSYKLYIIQYFYIFIFSLIPYKIMVTKCAKHHLTSSLVTQRNVNVFKYKKKYTHIP